MSCEQQTGRHRQTDHATCVKTGHILCYAQRCDVINTNKQNLVNEESIVSSPLAGAVSDEAYEARLEVCKRCGFAVEGAAQAATRLDHAHVPPYNVVAAATEDRCGDDVEQLTLVDRVVAVLNVHFQSINQPVNEFY